LSAIIRGVVNKPVVHYLVLFLLFFALLFLRRSPQLLSPQVWDEDGTQIIPGLLDHGLRSLIYPVNGYLVVLPKLISAASLAISGVHYPFVSTLITWIFIICVCMLISLAPTYLKGGVFLGAATLLIPTDPEVYGIPLYSFWWATLLLFLVVLWDENSRDLYLRLLIVLIGGLSSPIILLVAPLLVIRAVLLKGNRRELAIMWAALGCCGVQAFTMLHSAAPLTVGAKGYSNLRYVLPKFLGEYLAGNFIRRTNHLVLIATGFLLAFLLITIPFVRKHPHYLYLVGLWCGSIYLTGRRVNLALLQPRYAGPRYYFLPFVLLAWFLVSVMAEKNGWRPRVLAAALLLVSVYNMVPVRTRPQQDFEWRRHIADCIQSDPCPIPISYDGQRSWFLQVNRRQCLALRHAGLIPLGTSRP
jgi:hypothetical protein